MTPVKISYEEFAEMDEAQRTDYRDSWLYIHGMRARCKDA